MKKWVKKAFQEWERGCTVIALLPARTNTAWWHDWVMKGEVRFIRGEVTFKGQKNGLWIPMAIVVFKGHNAKNHRVAAGDVDFSLRPDGNSGGFYC
jgi:site-specific DNA-methyltransferase (adenine-specific)